MKRYLVPVRSADGRFRELERLIRLGRGDERPKKPVARSEVKPAGRHVRHSESATGRRRAAALWPLRAEAHDARRQRYLMEVGRDAAGLEPDTNWDAVTIQKKDCK